MPHRPAQRAPDDGFTTVAFLAAAGITLITFVLLAQFAVWQYARGAARAAITEAARTGARADATPAQCEARANEALDGLLGTGTIRHSITITCTRDLTSTAVTAHVTLQAWLPPTPDWTFTLTATNPTESRP